MTTNRITAAIAIATMLTTAACVDPRGASRTPAADVAATLLVPGSGPIEISFSRLLPPTVGVPSGDAPPRGGDRVADAARRILTDLRQVGDTRAAMAPGLVTTESLARDLDRLQRHVAAAWHFDFDPARIDFLRVRLRAAIAPDGSVRAIELLDSHGGPEEVLARFVEDAIATLDWSSPLPIDRGAGPMRALVFRFEAGRARR